MYGVKIHNFSLN